MGKECGAWVSRRLWGGGNTSPLKTTAWEATFPVVLFIMLRKVVLPFESVDEILKCDHSNECY